MILVTGATGHIGNVLIRTLLERGESVRALILKGEDTTSLRGLPIERIEGDVLVPGTIRKALLDVGVVYHLAGLISVGNLPDDLVRRVNVQGTKNVALAAQEAGVERLVYVSSIHAFVRSEDDIVIDESVPFDPENPAGEYDRSKAQATLAVLEAVRSGLDAVIVCPTGVIGPEDFKRSEMGRMVTTWMKRRPHFMIDGCFDFVDVRDLVGGLILAKEKGKAGETYILSGNRISLADMRSFVQKSAGIRSLKINVPVKLAKSLVSKFKFGGFTPYAIETVLGNSKISSDKAKHYLGYAVRPIAATISDTVGWWKRNQQPGKFAKWHGKVALSTGA